MTGTLTDPGAEVLGQVLAEVRAAGAQQIETTQRIAAERDDAQAEARAARAEAAGQYRVNLELQRHLDEYGQDRRAYEATIANLRAENERLRATDTLKLPRYRKTRRGGWRWAR